MATGLIKIAIVGAESTGKTSLAQGLAAHYQTQWVPEYAREYLPQLSGAYTQHDVEAIAKGQIALEDKMVAKAKRLLICDTNLLVIKVWMDHSYGKTPNWVLDSIVNRKYHLHILTDSNIPYEPDPLREHPEMRDYFTGKYLDELENRQLLYLQVAGTERERLMRAIEIINKMLT